MGVVSNAMFSARAIGFELGRHGLLDFFDRLLPRLMDGRDAVRRLDEVAGGLGELPVRDLDYKSLPGRSGEVATSG